MRRILFRQVNHTYFNPNPDPALPPPPPPPPPPASRQFTQEEVNKMQADHKRALQQQNADLVNQLTQLRENVNLTQKEKDGLDAQISALSQQHLTETQKYQQQVDAWDKKYKQDTTALTDSLKGVTGEFHGLMIRNAIVEASNVQKAASTEQMQMLIGPHAKVVPETDKDGKPTGKLIAVLPTPITDAKTKVVTVVDLPIAAAIVEMKKNPQNANLFTVDGSGGFGGQGNDGRRKSSGETPNFSAMSAEEYRAYRQSEGMAKSTK